MNYTIYTIGDMEFVFEVLTGVVKMFSSQGAVWAFASAASALALFGGYLLNLIEDKPGDPIKKFLGGLVFFYLAMGPDTQVDVVVESTHTSRIMQVNDVPFLVGFGGYLTTTAMRDLYDEYTWMFQSPKGYEVSSGQMDPLRSMVALRDLQATSNTCTMGSTHGGFNLCSTIKTYIRECAMRDVSMASPKQEVLVGSVSAATPGKLWDTLKVDNKIWEIPVWLRTTATQDGIQWMSCKDAHDMVGKVLNGNKSGPNGVMFTEILIADAKAQGADIEKVDESLQKHFSAVQGAKDAFSVMLDRWLKSEVIKSFTNSKEGLATSQAQFQAAEQRRVNMAGQRSMWMEMSTALATFFEGFAIFIAPIMAVMMVMGGKAITGAVTYLGILVWVQTWPIVIVLINLYTDFAVSNRFEDLETSGGSLLSTSGLDVTLTTMESHLATSAMLVNLVPALSLFILFRGVHTMLQVANQANSPANMNSKVLAPDILGDASLGRTVSGNLDFKHNAKSGNWEAAENVGNVSGLSNISGKSSISTGATQLQQQAFQRVSTEQAKFSEAFGNDFGKVTSIGIDTSTGEKTGLQEQNSAQVMGTMAQKISNQTGMSLEKSVAAMGKVGGGVAAGLGLKAEYMSQLQSNLTEKETETVARLLEQGSQAQGAVGQYFSDLEEAGINWKDMEQSSTKDAFATSEEAMKSYQEAKSELNQASTFLQSANGIESDFKVNPQEMGVLLHQNNADSFFGTTGKFGFDENGTFTSGALKGASVDAAYKNIYGETGADQFTTAEKAEKVQNAVASTYADNLFRFNEAHGDIFSSESVKGFAAAETVNDLHQKIAAGTGETLATGKAGYEVAANLWNNVSDTVGGQSAGAAKMASELDRVASETSSPNVAQVGSEGISNETGTDTDTVRQKGEDLKTKNEAFNEQVKEKSNSISKNVNSKNYQNRASELLKREDNIPFGSFFKGNGPQLTDYQRNRLEEGLPPSEINSESSDRALSLATSASQNSIDSALYISDYGNKANENLSPAVVEGLTLMATEDAPALRNMINESMSSGDMDSIKPLLAAQHYLQDSDNEENLLSFYRGEGASEAQISSLKQSRELVSSTFAEIRESGSSDNKDRFSHLEAETFLSENHVLNGSAASVVGNVASRAFDDNLVNFPLTDNELSVIPALEKAYSDAYAGDQSNSPVLNKFAEIREAHTDKIPSLDRSRTLAATDIAYSIASASDDHGIYSSDDEKFRESIAQRGLLAGGVIDQDDVKSPEMIKGTVHPGMKNHEFLQNASTKDTLWKEAATASALTILGFNQGGQGGTGSNAGTNAGTGQGGSPKAGNGAQAVTGSEAGSGDQPGTGKAAAGQSPAGTPPVRKLESGTGSNAGTNAGTGQGGSPKAGNGAQAVTGSEAGSGDQPGTGKAAAGQSPAGTPPVRKLESGTGSNAGTNAGTGQGGSPKADKSTQAVTGSEAGSGDQPGTGKAAAGQSPADIPPVRKLESGTGSNAGTNAGTGQAGSPKAGNGAQAVTGSEAGSGDQPGTGKAAAGQSPAGTPPVRKLESGTGSNAGTNAGTGQGGSPKAGNGAQAVTGSEAGSGDQPGTGKAAAGQSPAGTPPVRKLESGTGSNAGTNAGTGQGGSPKAGNGAQAVTGSEAGSGDQPGTGKAAAGQSPAGTPPVRKLESGTGSNAGTNAGTGQAGSPKAGNGAQAVTGSEAGSGDQPGTGKAAAGQSPAGTPPVRKLESGTGSNAGTNAGTGQGGSPKAGNGAQAVTGSEAGSGDQPGTGKAAAGQSPAGTPPVRKLESGTGSNAGTNAGTGQGGSPKAGNGAQAVTGSEAGSGDQPGTGKAAAGQSPAGTPPVRKLESGTGSNAGTNAGTGQGGSPKADKSTQAVTGSEAGSGDQPGTGKAAAGQSPADIPPVRKLESGTGSNAGTNAGTGQAGSPKAGNGAQAVTGSEAGSGDQPGTGKAAAGQSPAGTPPVRKLESGTGSNAGTNAGTGQGGSPKAGNGAQAVTGSEAGSGDQPGTGKAAAGQSPAGTPPVRKLESGTGSNAGTNAGTGQGGSPKADKSTQAVTGSEAGSGDQPGTGKAAAGQSPADIPPVRKLESGTGSNAGTNAGTGQAGSPKAGNGAQAVTGSEAGSGDQPGTGKAAAGQSPADIPPVRKLEGGTGSNTNTNAGTGQGGSPQADKSTQAVTGSEAGSGDQPGARPEKDYSPTAIAPKLFGQNDDGNRSKGDQDTELDENAEASAQVNDEKVAGQRHYSGYERD